MIGHFRKSLYPWIDICPGDDNQATLLSFHRCRQALDDLIAMRITWNDYLEILAAEGVDVDSYCEDSLDNLLYVF